MYSPGEQLARYVPDMILNRLCDAGWNRRNPLMEHDSGAVMLIDISGFTPLTRQLMVNGASGLEQLTVILNAYFETMTAKIEKYGGNTVNFAGDALLAVWPGGRFEDGLTAAVQQAVQCGISLLGTLHYKELIPNLRLSLRVAIGAGPYGQYIVGGVRGRWELILSGDAIRQMSVCGGHAMNGEVLLSPEAYVLVQEHYKVQPHPDDNGIHGYFIRTRLTLPNPSPLGLPDTSPVTIHTPDLDSLIPYLPPTVVAAVSAGHTEWAAELRHITVLFIHLPGFHIRGDLNQVHQAVEIIQNSMHLQEGAINKISLDDKGIAVIAALGLPAMTHEDDASRALNAGLIIHTQLAKQGIRTSIGIATGPLFCGSIGGAIRCEYTMIGDTMNLAARLMEEVNGGILCDETTRRSASEHMVCENRGTMALKGYTVPINVYQPVEMVRTVVSKPAAPEKLVGRLAETEALRNQMAQLLQGSGGTVLISGEAGMGKSHLVHYARRIAEENNIRVLSGAGDSIERLNPYFPWRPILQESLVEDSASLEAVAARVRSLLPSKDHLLPLLNAALPLGLEDNEWTVHMTGRLRADNTQALLTELLLAVLGSEPVVLIMDDAHWMDSASWSLLLEASKRLPGALFVLAMRPDHPDHNPLPAECRILLSQPGLIRLHLDGLSEQDTVRLICDRLGVSALPEEARQLIWSKTEGHPLFSEELAYSLRDRGFLEVQNGQCRMISGPGGPGSLQDVLFNPTIQGIIMSRIDRLPPKEQLVLKAASVIGRLFTSSYLLGILPYATAAQEIEKQLSALERVNLTVLESLEPELAYLFRHIMTQEVTYNMLLHSQRQQLHRAAAQWLERRHNKDLAPYYSILAHHWSKAEDTDKAIGYLEQVGLQALKTGAYPEAVHAFKEILDKAPEGIPHTRIARWHRLLGESCMGVGDMAQASEQLRKALFIHGEEIAVTGMQYMKHLGKQMVLQLMHRFQPSRYLGRMEGRNPEIPELARCYFRLSEIAFFTNKPKDNLYYSLHGLNLGEVAGASVVLAQITGNMCVTAGIVSLHRLARVYKKQAFEVARKLNDLTATAWVHMDCSLYHLGIGEWEASREYTRIAMSVYEKIGDRRYWEACSYLAVKVLCYRDADFEASSKLAAAIYDSGQQSGNTQAKSWGLMAQGENLIYQGKTADALPLLLEAESLVPANIGLTEEIRVLSQLAFTYLHMGEKDKAKLYATKALALIGQSSPTAYYAYDGYAALVEVYLSLWVCGSSAEQTTLLRDLRASLRALRTFSGVFPIAKPRYLLYTGTWAWLQGSPKRAVRSWKRSLRLAKKLGMPYEEERASRALQSRSLGFYNLPY